MVKHLPLRDGEVSSNLTSDIGEHGKIRYAPRGLREQHEDVVGILPVVEFESYYLNGGARCVK